MTPDEVEEMAWPLAGSLVEHRATESMAALAAWCRAHEARAGLDRALWRRTAELLEQRLHPPKEAFNA